MINNHRRSTAYWSVFLYTFDAPDVRYLLMMPFEVNRAYYVKRRLQAKTRTTACELDNSLPTTAFIIFSELQRQEHQATTVQNGGRYTVLW